MLERFVSNERSVVVVAESSRVHLRRLLQSQYRVCQRRDNDVRQTVLMFKSRPILYQLTLQTSTNSAAESQAVHAYGIGQAYDSDITVNRISAPATAAIRYC